MTSLSRYLVRFKLGLTVRYGIFVEDRDGKTIVADAVLPQEFELQPSIVEDVAMGEFLPRGPNDEGVLFDDDFHRFVAAESKAAFDAAKRLPQDGRVRAGKLFRISVADGHAYYVVTKVSAKTCAVEWRGFGGDDHYVDHYLEWGGRFPIAKIEKYIRAEEGIRKLFVSQQLPSDK